MNLKKKKRKGKKYFYLSQTPPNVLFVFNLENKCQEKWRIFFKESVHSAKAAVSITKHSCWNCVYSISQKAKVYFAVPECIVMSPYDFFFSLLHLTYFSLLLTLK